MARVKFVNLTDSYGSKSFKIDSLGILSLATVLKEKSNHLISIIDFQHENIYDRYQPADDFSGEVVKITNMIMTDQPSIVSFYTMCNNYHLSIAVAQNIKRVSAYKDYFGGPQATLTAEDTIKAVECIDVISLGEGEHTITKLVESLILDYRLDDIPGIVFKDKNNIINNGMPELEKNLDLLPFLDYTFFDMSKIKTVNIDAGRGCPFSCTFCSTKSFWKRKFRLKSPKRIVEEMEYVYERYGINKFAMTHDLFTANRKKYWNFVH